MLGSPTVEQVSSDLKLRYSCTVYLSGPFAASGCSGYLAPDPRRMSPSPALYVSGTPSAELAASQAKPPNRPAFRAHCRPSRHCLGLPHYLPTFQQHHLQALSSALTPASRNPHSTPRQLLRH